MTAASATTGFAPIAVYLVTLILFPFAFVTGFRLVWGMLFTPFDLPERFRAE